MRTNILQLDGAEVAFFTTLIGLMIAGIGFFLQRLINSVDDLSKKIAQLSEDHAINDEWRKEVSRRLNNLERGEDNRRT